MSDEMVQDAAVGLARLYFGPIEPRLWKAHGPTQVARYRTSLDALFRDLVPLLRERDLTLSIYETRGKVYRVLVLGEGGGVMGSGQNANLPPALCLAMWDALKDGDE